MKTNTPQLRFPEFRNAPEWEIASLESCLCSQPDYGVNAPAVPYSEKLPTYLRITDISEDRDFINEEKVSVNINATYENSLHEGDIVLARTGASVGKSYKYKCKDGELVFAGFLIRIRPDKQKVYPDFLYQFLDTGRYWEWVGITSARSGQPGINAIEYCGLPIPMPSPRDCELSQREQKKIADCLSSLDGLISTESRKLDALASYKKGLMQQLFPAEGETVPKLRFPEFRNAPAWEKKELSSLAKKITNRNKENSIKRVLTNSAVDGVVDQSDYFERKIVNQNNLDNYFVIEPGDYVYNPRISITAPVGPISKNKLGKGIMSPLYTVFRFKNRNNNFYEQYFKTNLWHNYLKDVSNTGARHDRMNISIDNFMGMTLPFPDEQEQQKIANCLASLDELIAVQTEKLDGLKNFKKSLMQQLFPANSEAVK